MEITIKNKKYKVVDNLGFVHSRGVYAKVIDFNGIERVVIKVGGKWILAKPIFQKIGPMTGQAV